MEGSASSIVHGALWYTLKVTYRRNIQRDVVMKISRELDVDGIENQKIYQLIWRKSISPGPNYY